MDEFKTSLEGKTFEVTAKPIHINRPPIYKKVHQPVYVHQPVVVEQIPEVIKTKETKIIKKQPVVEVKEGAHVTKDLHHKHKLGGEEIPV